VREFTCFRCGCYFWH